MPNARYAAFWNARLGVARRITELFAGRGYFWYAKWDDSGIPASIKKLLY